MKSNRTTTVFLLAVSLCAYFSARANWLNAAGDALKTIATTATDIVAGAATETLNVASTSLATGGAVSPGAVAELDFCRRLASIPGGTMSLEYQRRCGNMAMVCQQVRMTNPNATMDPYCATVSGYGQMVSPWGASVAPMMPGVNTSHNLQNADPSKVGWSIAPPPPFGMTMGMHGAPLGGSMGAYGVPPGAEGVGPMIADNVIGRFVSGGSLGYNGYSGGGGRVYSADRPPE
ncbi:MAG: hypothetical protein H6925_06455 [Holosporaceae bacterium]|nr:MAG: hypothetical protein H6925_06455 [Holosporaceae bacterium]